MESYKSAKGRVVSQDNYTQSSQIRNTNCGELGHFARNWPTKKRSNGVQFKPQNQQKCNWGQRPITGTWTDSSIVSNFKASESSSALHSSEVYSSSVSDSSKYSSSSATDKSEAQYMKEFKDREEIPTLQCATSSVAQKASDECLQIPVGTGVDPHSQGSRDPESCHKAVQTMHNLSVLLLGNSSLSDNLSESDLQVLQSVICNVSQCLLKSIGVSKSTDVAAFMADEQLVAANSRKTEKDCYAAEENEGPVGTRSFQMSAEVYLSKMANIEVELNSIKSEIRCLRTGLEMEGVKKGHAGTPEHRDFETSANVTDVNNGSCPEVNIVLKENEFQYTCAPFSKERRHELPDLNLDPIMGDESFIGECYIKKYVDSIISQNNISEEPIQISNMNNTAHNPGNNLVEDDATNECPTKIGPPIDVHDLENVYVGNALEENPCLESDSTWEEVNFSEEDHN